MANLTSSGGIYETLAALQAPARKVPASLKRAYRNTAAVQSNYEPLINQILRQYGNYQPVHKTKEFQKLVEHYNKEYQNNARLAAGQTSAAAKAADAGYGNSYADAVSAAAYNSYMQGNAAALPALMAAAEQAYVHDKQGKKDAVKALRAQQSMKSRAAKQLFRAQLEGVKRENAAQRAGNKNRRKALESVLSKAVAKKR